MTAARSAPLRDGERLAGHVPITLLGVLHSRTGADWSTTMVEGPWMAGSDGVRRLSSLAVLADVGGSMPALVSRPSRDVAPVTATLAVDFAPRAATAAGPFEAEARIIEASPDGGLTSGAILDGAGRAIAAVTIAVRYVAMPEGLDSLDETFPLRADADLRIDEMLRIDAEVDADGARGSLRVAPWLCSPRGTMHGGMVPIAADELALRLLGGAAGWRSSTIWVNYIRPSMAGLLVSLRATIVHRGRGRAVVGVEGARGDGAVLWSAQLSYDRAVPAR